MAYTHATRFYFTRSSRRHRIGRAHVLTALEGAGVPTVMENGDLLWLCVDDRGIELEIVAFEDADDPDVMVVKHVKPSAFREREK